MNDKGEINQNIAMSSRVRLARNFKGICFPGRLNAKDSATLLADIRMVFFGSRDVKGSEYVYVELLSLDPIDKMLLIEKHLISPDLAASQKPCAAIISKDEQVSIMLNEEDHLRIQCLTPSSDIKSAYARCDGLERIFSDRFNIAFDDGFGYLTSCPTNLGTGMRVSFMLHLPALAITGHIKSILDACGKIGVAVRGLYGENSEASGNMFQFSNQGSLGRSEEEIIMSINDIKEQIVGHESKLRGELVSNNTIQFEDRVFRALGTLRGARVLSSEEYMRLWSDVRLGVDTGVIGDVDIGTLDHMLTLIQPAYIQKMFGRMLNSGERDIQRASLVREMLSEKYGDQQGEQNGEGDTAE
ncbi:MAG: protein arginine kinase [Oscillospiraceae bacterium]|nr:protein arginine kinase [Oscillospiraceae bacterium]